MKSNKNFNDLLFTFFMVGIAYLFLAEPAYAYLDPGTGSYMLQLIFGGLFGGIFLVKMKWRRIRHFIANVWIKINGNKKK